MDARLLRVCSCVELRFSSDSPRSRRVSRSVPKVQIEEEESFINPRSPSRPSQMSWFVLAARVAPVLRHSSLNEAQVPPLTAYIFPAAPLPYFISSEFASLLEGQISAGSAAVRVNACQDIEVLEFYCTVAQRRPSSQQEATR